MIHSASPSRDRRLAGLPLAILLAFVAGACGGASTPAAEPASAGPSAPSAGNLVAPGPAPSVSPAAPPASAAGASYQIGGKSLLEVEVFDLKGEIEKAGWKGGGFTYGGTIGQFQMFGVVAVRGDKKVVMGFTRAAKAPEPTPEIAKKHDLTTLYKLAKDGPLLYSIHDKASGVFVWIAGDTGGTEADAKELAAAVVKPAK